jgi:hypothetical protein
MTDELNIVKPPRPQIRRGFVPPVENTPEKSIPAAESENLIRPLTSDEQAIAARVAADTSKEWETIGEDSAIDYSLGKWIFDLPPEAKKMQDEKHYAFRWIQRTTSRIDELRTKQVPARWWICNRSNTPFLAHLCDPVLGAVIKEDQILMFQPWWMREKMRSVVAGVADGKSPDLTGMDGDGRGAARFAASKRKMGQGEPTRQEIKGGDQIIYDGDAEEAGGLGDIIAE